MKRPQLYLETSVWNFFFADDAPEKKELTERFFERIKRGEYEIFISDAVLEEIDRAEDGKKQMLLNLIKEYAPHRLALNKEVFELAQKYIFEKILPAGKAGDSIHAAVATIYEMDALISWNLKHLSNFRKMKLFNGINMKEGYFKRLELITPMEVADEEI